MKWWWCWTVGLFSAAVQLAALMPPIGVDAMVLSARTVMVSWSDSSGSSESHSDGSRPVYTLRYRQRSARTRYRYVNVTNTPARLNELRPNTEYEMSVKVSRGSRRSTWSMTVFVTTSEAGTLFTMLCQLCKGLACLFIYYVKSYSWYKHKEVEKIKYNTIHIL